MAVLIIRNIVNESQDTLTKENSRKDVAWGQEARSKITT